MKRATAAEEKTMGEGVFENGVFRMDDVRILDRSGNRRLPIGDDGFERVSSRSVFVDKSLLVADVLDGNSMVTLFCRPRRFGKTLAMTMLRSFLETPIDGVNRSALFEGLAIWDAEDGRYREYQGVYPVVYLSLNDVKKESWDVAYGAIEGKVAAEYQRHDYLATSDRLNEAERAQFVRVRDANGSRDDVESSLRQLTLYLRKHHGRNAVVLIDEYDAPVMAARANGYYHEAVGFLKGWLTGALKDGGAALEFACLTGVQRIAKESIFSDLNNLTVDTPLNKHFDERFGFTEKETRALAVYLGHPHTSDELKHWYDGYRFGDADIYNPWSVLNYFGNGCEPGVYWANTASNAVVGEAVRSSGPDALQDVFQLLEPQGVVWRPLDMAVVFPESGLEGDALWSMLYLAGYLTTDDVEDPTDQYRLRPLRVPDYEIARVFRGEVIERFREVAGGSQRLRVLHGLLAAGDARGVAQELTRILETSPSCRDMVGENSYHMLMLGLLFGMPGYADPLSNREAGRGYFDVRLNPEPPHDGVTERVPIVLEFKVLPVRETSADPVALVQSLEELAHVALAQIAAKRYDAPADRSLRYGIAFCGKDVAVVCEG